MKPLRSHTALLAVVWITSVVVPTTGCPPAALLRGPQFVVEPFTSAPELPGMLLHDYSGEPHTVHQGQRCPRAANLALVPLNAISIATLNVVPLVAVLVDPRVDEAERAAVWHFESLGMCFPVHGWIPCYAFTWDSGSP